MAQLSNNLEATSALDVVNACLIGVGEAPIPDLTSATQADVDIIVSIIDQKTRQLLSKGWDFNSEIGFEVSPADTYMWTGSDGTSETLNIFEAPPGLLHWKLTRSADQALLDAALRLPRDYTGTTQVFYDRANNRDGFPQDERDYLYIDATFWMDFDEMPEEARQYLSLLSLRQFSSIMHERSALAVSDEELRHAYGLLRVNHGRTDRFSIFDNNSVRASLGRRRLPSVGPFDTRSSPRP